MSNKRKYSSFVETTERSPENGDYKLKKQKDTSLFNNSALTSKFSKVIIKGDGNCLFRAILYSLIGEDTGYKSLRKDVCNFIIANKEKYKSYFVHDEKGLISEMKKMKKNGIWGTNLELYAASEMLHFNFEVFNSADFSLYCSCEHFSDFPTIYLEYENSIHFNSLIPIQKNQNEINKGNKKDSSFQTLKKSIQNRKEVKQFDTCKNLQKIKQPKLYTTSSVTINLSKPILAHRVIYPPSKNNNDTYNEVYKFLENKIIPKRFHPLENHKKEFENWRKDISKQYSLDKVSTNSFSLSRLRFKRSNQEDVILPFQDEISRIIEQNHTGFSVHIKKHFGQKITIENIMQSGLYWARMSADVQAYIKTCPSCIESRHEKPIKEKKVIIPRRPLERIQGDLIELDKELINACGNKFRYVFSCVDHFSKFKWCYVIEDKSAITIIRCLQNVIITFGPPSNFHTDNGKEFKNIELSNFLKKNKIKQIYGAVRHPQTQGVVERHNRELRDFLEKSYQSFQAENKGKEEWQLSLEVENFRARENNRVHTVTRYKPNELVISKDKLLIEEVQKNIERYFQKEAQKNNQVIYEILKKDTLVFVVKEVAPNKNHTRLDKALQTKLSKKKKIKIPAIVTKDYKQNDTSVQIQIVISKQHNLKIGQTYHINSKFLSLTDKISWNQMVEVIRKEKN